jgi:hypothetical protein
MMSAWCVSPGRLYREGSVYLNEEEHAELRRWFVEKLLQMKVVFGGRLQGLAG